MANQVALRVLTRPGDDVIVSRESHAVWHETGGSAANAGVQFTEIGPRGVFTVDDFLAVRKPRGHAIYPPTTLLEIENTHNRSGGIVFPQDEVSAVRRRAPAVVATFLDGARLWNAAVASGQSGAELAAPFDLVAVALSKGLGAPGGSLLAGSRELIERATRYRRMFGGAMRQTGIYAAAGLSRSIIIVPAWPRITPTRNASPRGCPITSGSTSTLRRCRRTSSCSGCARAHPTPRPSSSAPANAACCCFRSERARCAR